MVCFVPTSDLTKELLAARIKNHFSSVDNITGTSSLLSCKTAFLAEITSTTVLRHITDHVQGGILLSPSSLLMLPKHDTAFWTRLVDGLARADAASCVTSIHWRRSNGGRPWIRPQMLIHDLRNKVQLAKKQSSGQPGLDTCLFLHSPYFASRSNIGRST